jgi:hypothetical protein
MAASAASDSAESSSCDSVEPASLCDVGSESRRLAEESPEELSAPELSAPELSALDEAELESLPPVSATAVAPPALPIKSPAESTRTPVAERKPCTVRASSQSGMDQLLTKATPVIVA